MNDILNSATLVLKMLVKFGQQDIFSGFTQKRKPEKTDVNHVIILFILI